MIEFAFEMVLYNSFCFWLADLLLRRCCWFWNVLKHYHRFKQRTTKNNVSFAWVGCFVCLLHTWIFEFVNLLFHAVNFGLVALSKSWVSQGLGRWQPSFELAWFQSSAAALPHRSRKKRNVGPIPDMFVNSLWQSIWNIFWHCFWRSV